MNDFGGKLAVITGGGTGMGRELARQLVAEGCDVAMCDVIEKNMLETKALCEAEGSQGRVVSTHICDVSDEASVERFRDEVVEAHGTDHIDLLFNNAGVGGGSSFVEGERDNWERTFNICWYGVYYTARAFMDLLVASEDSHMVNTSSVNGFWASLGPQSAHSAYSAAKFAVKGFTEALVTDFRNNAPHVKVSVVMPGHIGTSIALNANKILSGNYESDDGLSEEDLAATRKRWQEMGLIGEDVTDDQLKAAVAMMGTSFRDNAPTTAGEAAKIILDGVKAERWRILVGNDAHVLDELVRGDPETAYETDFLDKVREKTDWVLGQ